MPRSLEAEPLVKNIDKMPRCLEDEPYIRKIDYPVKKSLEYNDVLINDQLLSICQEFPNPKEAKRIIMPFSAYVEAPIIHDLFFKNAKIEKQDIKRNEAEQILKARGDEKNYKFYKSNKLRVTNIRNLLGLYDLTELGYIIPIIPINPSTKNLSQEIRYDVSIYGGNDLIKYMRSLKKDKMKVVKKVSKFARNICIDFIEKHQNS